MTTVVAGLVAAWLTGAGISVGAAAGGVTSPTDAVVTVLAGLPALVLGLLVVRRRPGSPAGPALLGLVAAPVLTHGVEIWAATATGPDPWWGADVVASAGIGIWVFNLAGFVALCLVFPAGRLPGRGWAALPWLWLASALAVVLVVSPDDGVPPTPAELAAIFGSFVPFLATLLAAAASLVVRYRRGDALTRLQLRWLLLGVGTVPLLLVAGWVAEAFGASPDVAYTGFMLALLVAVPAAVAVAILRHDLLDLDRLLGGTASWLLTTLVSAGVFAAVVLGAASLGAASGVGVTTAAFVTALALLPLHRRVHGLVARVVDRERAVTVEAVRRFVRRVRDADAEPEEVEAVLRTALGDDDLRLLLVAPGSDELVDLTGAPAGPGTGEVVPLTARGAEVARLVLGRTSRRRVRLARELALEARLPIEVSRLRLALRGALDDARASRARLVEAAADERKRLERDLHDGAQQGILAVGMRLRSAQRRFEPGDPTWQDLEGAVSALETTVAELRRLAHGVRPSGLDDGLENAIRALVADSPVPVEVAVAPVQLGETVATTAYYVVAEGLANAFKHARASGVRIVVEANGEGVRVEVADDGVGGAVDAFGLSALRDRVAALGGRVEVHSPPGAGTTVRAVL